MKGKWKEDNSARNGTMRENDKIDRIKCLKTVA